jgi:hypothetical protein
MMPYYLQRCLVFGSSISLASKSLLTFTSNDICLTAAEIIRFPGEIRVLQPIPGYGEFIQVLRCWKHLRFHISDIRNPTGHFQAHSRVTDSGWIVTWIQRGSERTL